MAAIPEQKTELLPPHWEYWRNELWHHVVDGDDPYGFMGWPCIYHTMLQNHWIGTVEKEATEMALANGGLYPAHVTDESPFYPKDYWIRGLENSANLLKQLYHLWRWEEASGKKISDLESIHEFGGGYGAMALMARRLGFAGSYTICDSPEFSLLQKFFLDEMGVVVEWQDRPSGSYDLSIGCYSLSEVGSDLRAEFEHELKADNYLFLYSDRFDKYDNVEFFNLFMARRNDLTWNTGPIVHMPPTSIYSFGF